MTAEAASEFGLPLAFVTAPYGAKSAVGGLSWLARAVEPTPLPPDVLPPQLLVDDIVTELMPIVDFELQLPDGPGIGVDTSGIDMGTAPPPNETTWREMVLGMIPQSPVQVMADVNVLPLIVFSLLIGIGINCLLSPKAGIQLKYM